MQLVMGYFEDDTNKEITTIRCDIGGRDLEDLTDLFKMFLVGSGMDKETVSHVQYLKTSQLAKLKLLED